MSMIPIEVRARPHKEGIGDDKVKGSHLRLPR